MPGEVIDRPNPQPLPSQVPQEVMALSVKLDKTKLDEETYRSLQLFRHAANYIAAGTITFPTQVDLTDVHCVSAAMIFLTDNVLLERDLSFADIKPRLLGMSRAPTDMTRSDVSTGHWGTCPGLTLVYAHLNALVTRHDLDMIFVVGPGHGAPAILASLWIEGSLQRFYPQYKRSKEGLHNLITGFSTPHGFPRWALYSVGLESSNNHLAI